MPIHLLLLHLHRLLHHTWLLHHDWLHGRLLLLLHRLNWLAILVPIDGLRGLLMHHHTQRLLHWLLLRLSIGRHHDHLHLARLASVVRLLLRHVWLAWHHFLSCLRNYLGVVWLLGAWLLSCLECRCSCSLSRTAFTLPHEYEYGNSEDA